MLDILYLGIDTPDICLRNLLGMKFFLFVQLGFQFAFPVIQEVAKTVTLARQGFHKPVIFTQQILPCPFLLTLGAALFLGCLSSPVAAQHL